MVDYLRTTNDEVTKTEVVKRIGELAERFAPDTQWFLDTMNQVCAAALIPPHSASFSLAESRKSSSMSRSALTHCADFLTQSDFSAFI